MSVLDGPGEGTWSVFAQKVVEQRDAAIARAEAAEQMVAEMRAKVDHAEQQAANAVGALEMVKGDGDFDQLHEVTRGAVADVLAAPIAGRWCLASERDAAIARADELTRDLDEVTTALGDAHTREATLRAENKRLTERNEAMREPMRRLRDAMGMPAQGEGYVVDSIIKERDEALRLLATRVEAKRLDAAREENERLRAACTLALSIMEQKNRVNVPPFAKFITVDFAPEDIAVLRAALEKKP